MSDPIFMTKTVEMVLAAMNSAGLKPVIDGEAGTITCDVDHPGASPNRYKLVVEFKRRMFCVTATSYEFEKIDEVFYDQIAEFTIRANYGLTANLHFDFDMRTGVLSTRNTVVEFLQKPSIGVVGAGVFFPIELFSGYREAIKSILEENADVAEAVAKCKD